MEKASHRRVLILWFHFVKKVKEIYMYHNVYCIIRAARMIAHVGKYLKRFKLHRKLAKPKEKNIFTF